MKENSPFGRRYDREFKENAVALVRAGRTVSQVARDLGVTTWSLSRWLQLADGGQTQKQPATLAAERRKRGSFVACARKTTTCVSSGTS